MNPQDQRCCGFFVLLKFASTQSPMLRYLFFLLLLWSSLGFSQIKGTITNTQGKSLPYVNIYLENSFVGTTSNENGSFELPLNTIPETPIVFQFLGHKTQRFKVSTLPFELHVVLEEEFYELHEVVLSAKDNPAHAIIKKAIANRKTNALKMKRFEADFYSKGFFTVKNIPKKILGKEVGDFKGSLDSTRSGVLYLSETVSKVKFEKPNRFKEEIIASKVAGDNKGFSFNTAGESNYDLYENIINKNYPIVSPIAQNAFEYYHYKLENTFQENGFTINKIAIKPKRKNDAAFEGTLYIVEDSWAIFGAELHIKGIQVQQPFIEQFQLKQHFIYNSTENLWVKNLQTIEFTAGIFKIDFTGKYTHVFSNYVFKEEFEKKLFNKEIVSFVKDANTKTAEYWNNNRLVPLTAEELKTYRRKDSIQSRRESKIYLDSIDQKKNQFKAHQLIIGHTYKNTYEQRSWVYDGLLKNSGMFNTVQGWVFKTGVSHLSWHEQTGKNTNYNLQFDYGTAEQQLRYKMSYVHQFNQINYANITLAHGNTVQQFNPNEPISELGNTVSTLFFKNNYMKLYENQFTKINYGIDVFSGLYLSTSLEHENRKALFNHTFFSAVEHTDEYTSNHPLTPFDFTTPNIENHNITRISLDATLKFGQKYISHPNRRFNIPNEKYPVIKLHYEQVLQASAQRYHFSYLALRADYQKSIADKGTSEWCLKMGTFFNENNISFIDYKHFNGNQTHVNLRGNYTDTFNLLPYYTLSTNKPYAEIHYQHNFKGYIMNKIPLLNLLKWNFIISGKYP